MFKELKSVTYSVNEMESAKKWYNSVLNTTPIFTTPFISVYQIGGSSLSLLKQDTPKQSESSTTTYWEVECSHSAFEKLQEHGAKMISPIQTIMNTTRAKLQDPFGNIIGISSSQSAKSKKTIETDASETAMIVTFCRALCALDERDKIRGNDNLAHHFITDNYKRAFESSESRRWAKDQLGAIYGYANARNSYGDELFRTELKNNIPQIVILGAGYDTRSYRYSHLIRDTNIFEVDIAVTQERKIELLIENNIDIPQSVHFAVINVKEENLAESLKRRGYAPAKRTLFLWEGVTPYLTEDAMLKTLHFLQNHSAPESTIFFDYLTEKQCSKVDAEPFLFWKSSSEIVVMLSEFGIEVEESLHANDIEERFLSSNSEEVIEKSVPYFSFIYGKIGL